MRDLKGVPVAAAYPTEGAIGIVPNVSVPKGSQTRELAQYFDLLPNI